MIGEKKWIPGPANENSDNPVDELGKPLKKLEKEEIAPIPESAPTENLKIDEIERLKNLPVEIDGEPVIETE